MHECYRGRTTIARPLIRNQRCLGKASRDAQQAMPGSNREIVASSHDGFNSVRAAATRDKKLSFLSREASATYTNAPPGYDERQVCSVCCPHDQPGTRFW